MFHAPHDEFSQPSSPLCVPHLWLFQRTRQYSKAQTFLADARPAVSTSSSGRPPLHRRAALGTQRETATAP
ncbi:unnamed protein product [Parajaminaea phylloscopi]